MREKARESLQPIEFDEFSAIEKKQEKDRQIKEIIDFVLLSVTKKQWLVLKVFYQVLTKTNKIFNNRKMKKARDA